MAEDPLTLIPKEYRAGDTWFFELQYSDYPASAWDLLVYWSSPATTFSATAAANGDAHRFTIAATTTDDYEPGEYEYMIRAEHQSDGRRFTVGEGTLEILPSLETQGDHRHRVKQILDSLDAAIANRATSDQLSVSIAGRSISRMSVDDLILFRAWYSQQWKRIEARRRRKAFGTSNRGNIVGRFS